MKKSILSLVIGLMIGTLFGSTVLVSKADSNVLKSRGIIQYDANNDGDVTDSADVIIDSGDFDTLDGKIGVNSTQLSVLNTGFEEHSARIQGVEERVGQVELDVESVNESLEWKSLPSVVGTSVIDLPSDYSEFIVDIKVNEYNAFSFSFIKNQLTNVMQPYNNGFWLNSTNGAKCGVMVSKTQVQLDSVILGDSNYVASSTVTVHYR